MTRVTYPSYVANSARLHTIQTFPWKGIVVGVVLFAVLGGLAVVAGRVVLRRRRP
jgi:hypothetical protein